MTIRNVNGITAAVFFAAILLHITIISAVFRHFDANRAVLMPTRFVMQSVPQSPVSSSVPAPQKTKPKPKSKPKPKLKPVEKKNVPVSQPVLQEKSIEPDATAEDVQTETTEDGAAREGSLAGTGSTAVDFKSLIVQCIAEKKIYPNAARKRNQEGSVTINIVVLKSGELVRAEIISPCTYKFLNEAALASVRAAAPFPLGDNAPDQIELTVTLEYCLEG